MDSKTGFLTLILSVLIFSACQKEPDPKPLPEPGYPTVYKPLTGMEWNERNVEFQEINIYDGLSLNEYGFVEGKIPISKTDSITKNFLIEKIDAVICNYKKFLGIPENVVFNYKNQILIDVPYMIPGGRTSIASFYEDKEKFGKEDYWSDMIDGIKFEYFLEQNKIENRILNGFELAFNFNLDDNFIEISGFWIPELLIPQVKYYSKDEAFMIARNEVLERTGNDIWEIKYDYHTYSLLQKFTNDDKIEIRDCWIVYTSAPYYLGYRLAIYIDSQTGEIIKYYNRM